MIGQSGPRVLDDNTNLIHLNPFIFRISMGKGTLNRVNSYLRSVYQCQ